jgi:hypothetical protein
MEKIDTKSPEERGILQDELIEVLEFSNQVLGEKHKFSRSIASEERSKMVNHFPLVPLVIDIKKSELSFNNIPFNPSTKKPLFSKNKSLSSISSKQTVKTSNNDKLTRIGFKVYGV